MHSVRGYRKKDGTYVRPHLARNPGRAANGVDPSGYSGGRRKAIMVTLTIAGLGTAAVTIYSSLPGNGVSRPTADAPSSVSAKDFTDIRLDLDRTRTGLIAEGYTSNVNLRFDKSCAANSYGQVRQFFLSNSCKWLARASLTLRASGQVVALVAIAWVDMPKAAQANRYKHLVDAPGTGNITELTRVEGPYKNVRYSGMFYASGLFRSAVWNAEVQPINQLPASTSRTILGYSNQ